MFSVHPSGFSTPVFFALEPPQCKQQTIEKTVMEISFIPGTTLHHDVYTPKAVIVLLFALLDDYSESVELDHTIPEGFSIKFPHSKQVKRQQNQGMVRSGEQGWRLSPQCL